MNITTRAAQIAGLGLLLLGGCTVNNPPPAQVIREQPSPTATIVAPSGTSAPPTVVLQPRY
jgi:hypothetical protein